VNAQHILSRWERVQRTGITPDRWLMVLRVARAGAAGISSFDLAAQTKTQSGNCQLALRDAIESGLIAKSYAQQEHAILKRSVLVRYTITDKGLDFLALKPMPENSNPEAAA